MNTFLEVEKKLKFLLRTIDTYQIYDQMGISKGNYYTMRCRESIPYKKIIDFCRKKGFDLNYVFSTERGR